MTTYLGRIFLARLQALLTLKVDNCTLYPNASATLVAYDMSDALEGPLKCPYLHALQMQSLEVRFGRFTSFP